MVWLFYHLLERYEGCVPTIYLLNASIEYKRASQQTC